MKKYIKPEIEINLLDLASNIAAETVSTTFVNNVYDNDVGTLAWEELF